MVFAIRVSAADVDASAGADADADAVVARASEAALAPKASGTFPAAGTKLAAGDKDASAPEVGAVSLCFAASLEVIYNSVFPKAVCCCISLSNISICFCIIWNMGNISAGIILFDEAEGAPDVDAVSLGCSISAPCWLLGFPVFLPLPSILVCDRNFICC